MLHIAHKVLSLEQVGSCSITENSSPKPFHNNLQSNKPSQKQKNKKMNFLTSLKHHASSSFATKLNYGFLLSSTENL
jgi:hypothetical protein